MKLGVLFSGGKDSALAAYRASKKNDVACLITVESENPESYFFHTPNIRLTMLQSEAMGLPIVTATTKGEKELELQDLELVIKQSVKEHGIEGIITGAIDSVYQSTRVQRICKSLGLWCFNPLWQASQVGIMEELIESGFRVIISGVFAYPMGKEMLGRVLDVEMLDELKGLNERHMISPSGEGGEFETLVLDSPMFKQRLEILGADRDYHDDSGVFSIKDARLVMK